MTPGQQTSNVVSWEAVAADVEQYPDSAQWAPWKALVRRFLRAGVEAGPHRYFRAGQSMHHLVFSTLDHHRLRFEPLATVEYHPPQELRIAYGATNLEFCAPELQAILRQQPQYAEIRVDSLTNGKLLVIAPDALPPEAKNALERLVAQRSPQRDTPVSYLVPIPGNSASATAE